MVFQWVQQPKNLKKIIEFLVFVLPLFEVKISKATIMLIEILLQF